MDSQLAPLFIDYAANKFKQYYDRIEACLAKLTEDQVWARGSDSENAIGNLVLHLCGNVRQWIVSSIGGKPDVRVREREFSTRGDISKADLLERMRGVLADAEVVIRGVTPEQLTRRVTIQNYKDIAVIAAIAHVMEHFALHTGQIIFATKMLTHEDMGFYKHLANPNHGEKTP